MSDLGVTKSLSRPQVSNDNPFSEAQFKTLKYFPTFPERFGSLQDAQSFCKQFFSWYNGEHKHSGIGYHTPEDVHYGRATAMRKLRQDTLQSAFIAHPERFVKKPPVAPVIPTAVWINPPVFKQTPVGLALEVKPEGSEPDARTQQVGNHGGATAKTPQDREEKNDSIDLVVA